MSASAPTLLPFAAVVVAAGSGQRLGSDLPKALVEVAGRPLVAHAVRRLAEAGATDIVVVAPPGNLDAVRAAVATGGLEPAVVPGGTARSDSVRAGLDALDDDPEVVAVHDAARGLAPADLVRRVVAAVQGDVVAAAPALPVADTLKRVEADDVVATVDRTPLVAVQTPQVFRTDVLRAAHRAGGDATDDLALVEEAVAAGRAQGRIRVVSGDPLAMKVTHPHDLVVVAALAQQEGGR